MKQAIERTWNKLKEECNKWDSLQIKSDDDSFKVYSSCFEKQYKMIKDNFMSEDTKVLDAHKQAALVVGCVLETQIIEQSSTDAEDQIPIGPYVVALNVALSLLEDDIKSRLCVDSYSDKQISINMPIPFACNTPYFEIMCRLLYHEDTAQNKNTPWKDLRYNVLEWADRFYLLEYITILTAGINPSVYRDIRTRRSEGSVAQ